MSEPKRLFFALELPSAVQKQIVQWRASHFPEDAGRPVAADNLHLTLAFLGEVSAEKQRALAALAGRLRQPGFTLTLRDARQAVPIPAPGFHWSFPVNEFVLYESSFGRGRTRYTALERYPFHKES